MGGPGSGKSTRPITRNRPFKKLICRFRSPSGKGRFFSESDAVRVCCAVITRGEGTVPGIVRRLEAECPAAGKKPSDIGAEDAAQEAINALAFSNEVMTDAFNRFLIINGILGALAVLGRIVPQARPLSIVATAARTNIATVMTRIGNARAANDERIQRIQELIRIEQNIRRAA